ncbi:RHS repeat protein, partial [bacterium]|nr:RHS repeat protein [bacterium]
SGGSASAADGSSAVVRTSFGNKAQGATLADGSSSGEQPAKQRGIEDTSVSGGESVRAASRTEASFKDELAAKLQGIKGLEDVPELVRMALSKMSREEIIAALEGADAGMAELIAALNEAGQALFGEGYDKSLPGRILNLVSRVVQLEPAKLILLGEENIPADVKLAAIAAQECQDAINVSRDEKGRVIEMLDRQGGRHAFTYEESGVTETITATLGDITVKHRDIAGRLLSEACKGESRTYSYVLDSRGQVKQTTVTKRTAGTGITVMQYDKSGRLISLEAEGTQKTFVYQGRGENEEVIATTCNELGEVREQRYFKAGRLVKVKQQDDSETKYEYMTDKTGKVLAMTAQVTDHDGETTILQYDGSGRLVSALGKQTKQVTKMKRETTMAEQALAFELKKQLFGDPRIDGKRIDMKLQLKGLNRK